MFYSLLHIFLAPVYTDLLYGGVDTMTIWWSFDRICSEADRGRADCNRPFNCVDNWYSPPHTHPGSRAFVGKTGALPADEQGWPRPLPCMFLKNQRMKVTSAQCIPPLGSKLCSLNWWINSIHLAQRIQLFKTVCCSISFMHVQDHIVCWFNGVNLV